jgi:hypothetical protein
VLSPIEALYEPRALPEIWRDRQAVELGVQDRQGLGFSELTGSRLSP